MNKYLNEDSESANTRTLRLFKRAGRQFAVFDDQISSVANWRQPTPLPHAPACILGVIGVEGRMLTLLDLGRMPGMHTSSEDPGNELETILALRGDEQLALAADELGEAIDIEDGLESKDSELIISRFKLSGDEISVLNIKELFSSAIQGRERRRRRF